MSKNNNDNKVSETQDNFLHANFFNLKKTKKGEKKNFLISVDKNSKIFLKKPVRKFDDHDLW